MLYISASSAEHELMLEPNQKKNETESTLEWW